MLFKLTVRHYLPPLRTAGPVTMHEDSVDAQKRPDGSRLMHTSTDHAAVDSIDYCSRPCVCHMSGCTHRRKHAERADDSIPHHIASDATSLRHASRRTSRTPLRHRQTSPASPAATIKLLFFSTCTSFFHRAHGVRVPFHNCLSDSYRLNDPALLQWVPLEAEAVFDTAENNHNLRLIVWGNVTGSRERVDLPPPDSDYWENDDETPGKIIREPEPNGVPKSLATTLYRKVNVATYEPWNEAVDFCQDGLVNGSCPLGPVFSLDGM
jgi:hypothetical protein